MVIVNGKAFEDADRMGLVDFLRREGYDPDRIAVECNGNIVPKSGYPEKIIENGDSLEIVGFVGGG